jgi:hypothetical protein
MDQVTTLVAFLKARLDEDEKAARSALLGFDDEYGTDVTTLAVPDVVWVASYHEVYGRSAQWPAEGKRDQKLITTGQPAATYPAEHIARHDPARVLVEVESKRRIVATFTELDAHPNRLTYAFMQQQWVALRAVIAGLALPYADHPDYRDEWRP